MCYVSDPIIWGANDIEVVILSKRCTLYVFVHKNAHDLPCGLSLLFSSMSVCEAAIWPTIQAELAQKAVYW